MFNIVKCIGEPIAGPPHGCGATALALIIFDIPGDFDLLHIALIVIQLIERFRKARGGKN